MRSRRPSRFPNVVRLLVLVMIAVSYAPLSQAGVRAADSSVIAIQDITSGDCVATTQQYASKDSTRVVKTWTEPCAPGSQLRYFVTTKSDAVKRGIPYVAYSDDPASNWQAVTQQGETAYPSSSVVSGQVAAAACTGGYFSKTMRIRTFTNDQQAPGGTVESKVWYYRYQDPDYCHLIGIVQSRDRLVVPKPSGQRLYWARMEVTRPYAEEDRFPVPNCPQFANSGAEWVADWRNWPQGTWRVYAGGYYYDYISNQNSTVMGGCLGDFGEKYSNRMTLP